MSVGAVSRILNDDTSLSVRHEVRQRVRDTADRQGYHPNTAAQNLRQGRTGIVGVFCSLGAVVAPSTSGYLEGIERRLGLSSMEAFYRFTAGEEDATPASSFRCDVALVLQGQPPTLGRDLRQRAIPFVCINESIDGAALSIMPDEQHGMQLILDHLRELGHRRVAYVNAFYRGTSDLASPLLHLSVRARHQALLKLVPELGIDLVAGHAELPMGSDLASVVEQAVRREKATALVGYNYMITIALLRGAHQLGLVVPGDVSIVGFDDVYPMGYLWPAATVVGVNATEAGKMGADAALALAESNDRPAERQRLVPFRLIRRESTAPPRSTTS